LIIEASTAEGYSFLESHQKANPEKGIIDSSQNLVFRVREEEYFFNFIFSQRRQLRLQLIFILKDRHELENIFHIGSHSLIINL
jgi:hypothetical protein